MKRSSFIITSSPFIIWSFYFLLVWFTYQAEGNSAYLLALSVTAYTIFVPIITVKLVEKQSLVQRFGLQSSRFLILIFLVIVSTFATFVSGNASWDYFSGIVLAPITEELFFRGYIQGKLMDRNFSDDLPTLSWKVLWRSILIPVLVASTIFGISHIFKDSLVGIPQHVVFGIIEGFLFLFTGSILFPIMFHMVNNLYASWNVNGSPILFLPFWTILIMLPPILLLFAEVSRKKQKTRMNSKTDS